MHSLIDLLKRWQPQGVGILPPVAPAVVRDTFAAVGSVATSDVLALYARLGGMEEMDDEYWRLWSLDEVRRENAQPSQFGVLFSDYMLSCWCYRLKPNSDDTSSVLVDYFDDRKPSVVAESVAEFFDSYVADPTHLLDSRSLLEARRRR